jgi:hypothetical protein
VHAHVRKHARWFNCGEKREAIHRLAIALPQCSAGKGPQQCQALCADAK